MTDNTETEAPTIFNNWFRFQRYAQRNGFDRLRFLASINGKLMSGRWLDAYFGFVLFDGQEGFVTVDQLDEFAPDAECMVIREGT